MPYKRAKENNYYGANLLRHPNKLTFLPAGDIFTGTMGFSGSICLNHKETESKQVNISAQQHKAVGFPQSVATDLGRYSDWEATGG